MVEYGFNFHENEVGMAFVGRLLQPGNGLVVFLQTHINERNEIG